MAKGILVDKFKSKTVGLNISFEDITEYATSYPIDDTFPDNGHITKLQAVTLIGSAVVSTRTYEIPFTDTISIDWQTDLIDGTNTYADALGNNLPKVAAYSGNDTDGYDINMPQVHITRTSGLIGLLTVDQPGDWVLVF